MLLKRQKELNWCDIHLLPHKFLYWLLGLMDSQLEKKTCGRSFSCMITAARLLYVQRWKVSEMSMIGEWLVNMMNLQKWQNLLV